MCSWFIVGFSIRWLSHFLAPVALTWRFRFGVSSCFCVCLYFVWPHFIMLWCLCRLSVRIYCMCSYFWMILLCVLLLVLRCTWVHCSSAHKSMFVCLSDTGGQAGVDIVSHLCMVSGYCITRGWYWGGQSDCMWYRVASCESGGTFVLASFVNL